MSAAEKLKALAHDQFLEGRYPTFPGDRTVLAALPQIVAVVEAAAASASHHDYWLSRDTCSLCKAVSALDEALGK